MNKKKTVIILVAIIVALISLYALMAGGSPKVDSYTVSSAEFGETVLAVGSVESSASSEIKAEVGGVIQTANIPEGSTVRSGDILFTIASQDQNFSVAQKKAAYDSAAARYADLADGRLPAAKQDLAKAETKKAAAKDAYDDSLILYQAGAISKSSLDAAEVAYQEALSNYDDAARTLASLSSGGALQIQALSDMQAARSAYDQALAQKSKYEVRSPQNGVLLKKYAEAGASVQIGQALADVGDLENIYVAADLDERYFSYMSTGMDANVFIDENNKFKASVSSISPLIDATTGTFSIRLALTDPFPYKASALTVNIEVILKSPIETLAVPKSYILQDDDGSYVWKYQNGRIAKTGITASETLSINVPVESGVVEGDVLVSPQPDFEDGMKVSIK